MAELDRVRALGKALNQSEVAHDALTAALTLLSMDRDPVEELKTARTAVEAMHQQVKLSLIDARLDEDEPLEIEGSNAVE